MLFGVLGYSKGVSKMPVLGEIRKGTEIGYKTPHKFIWIKCLDCKKEWWTQTIGNKPKAKRCHPCASRLNVPRGERNPSWKGGKYIDSRGYVRILLDKDSFFYPMAQSCGYVMEHRLVVAKALGRCLLPWEVVHHKGTKYASGSKENRADNRYPENLQLLPHSTYHLIDTETQSYIKRLEHRIAKLEAICSKIDITK